MHAGALTLVHVHTQALHTHAHARAHTLSLCVPACPAQVLGAVFEAIRQPVINGYLIAGALVGPGGLDMVKVRVKALPPSRVRLCCAAARRRRPVVGAAAAAAAAAADARPLPDSTWPAARPQELVQVESLAQLGVQLLLFGLGLELSINKLRAVWGVAVLGEPPPQPHAHSMMPGTAAVACAPARRHTATGPAHCNAVGYILLAPPCNPCMRTHTVTRAHTHACTRAHAHTHTHTHACACVSPSCPAALLQVDPCRLRWP